jgi:pilus assembly protein Flp/PilA
VKRALELVRVVARDNEGASLLEYTVLLGIMLVAAIGTIVLVGQWVSLQWTTLQTMLP